MQAVRQRRTSQDNSRGMPAPKRAIRLPDGVRLGLFAAGLAGVAGLVLATFSTVIRITVGTTTRLANLDTSLSGWDRHGPALLVVAGLALVMLFGAARGAFPAAAAVLACGVAALFVVVAFDVPHLDDTGQVGRLYSDASAGPGAGFWLELGGGVLLCVSGGGLLALAHRSDGAGTGSRRTTRRGEGVADEAHVRKAPHV
jgi:hypothetical protein